MTFNVTGHHNSFHRKQSTICYNMKDTDIMIFGKFKGKMLGEIDLKERKKISPFMEKFIEYLESNLEYYKQQIG